MTDEKQAEFNKALAFIYSNQLSHKQLVDYLDKRPKLKQRLKEHILKNFRERKENGSI